MQTTPQNQESLTVQTVAETPVRKPQSYLPSIDGLRGLAAMMVVVFHSWAMSGMAHLPQFTVAGVTVPLYQVFIPWYSSVYLFFVLSGFCLAYPFLANPGRKDNWPGYFLNRVRRILPAYVISFVILFLLGQWIRHVELCPPPEKFLFETFKTNRFIQELLLFKKSRIVGSYWTLVLEWRWYLFFPAFLLLARRISPLLLLAATYAFAVAAQKTALCPILGKATLLPLATLLPVFIWGIWAARLTARPPETLPAWERALVQYPLWGLFAAVLWAIALRPPLLTGTPLQFAFTWGPFYFFLVLSALNQPWFRWIFSSAPFVKLGTISYSVYLLQEPIIRAGHIFLDRPEHGPWRLMAHHYLLLPTLCVLVGWGFYLIGEKPFLKRRS